MPRPPGIIDQINGVVDFVQDPCQAPWTLYLETALEPAGDALLALVLFGLDDVVRGFARPNSAGFPGRRSRRKGRKARRGRKGRGARKVPRTIPEFGEQIGKRIPGAQTVRARKVSQGVNTLWAVDGVIQRGLWWWLVADVTSDFFYEWSTAILESRFCMEQQNPQFLATADGGGAAAIIPNNGLLTPNVEKVRGGITHTGASTTYPKGRFTHTATVSTRNPSEGPVQAELITSSDPFGENVLGSSGEVTIQGMSTGSMVAASPVQGPASVTDIIRLKSGFLFHQMAMTSGMGRGNPRSFE